MPNTKIFISYCHDNTDKATRLHADLVSQGEQVWWDKDVLPGQNWKHEIKNAMRSSCAIILCFSKQTEARSQSGLYPEARDALEMYRAFSPGVSFIFPIRFCDCTIPQFEIDGTTSLEHIQRIDLFPTSKWDERIQLLIKALRRAPNHP